MAAAKPRPLRLAVLISGTGRTLKNLLERIDAGSLDSQVSLVIASTPNAKGLQFAEKATIPIRLIERSQFPNREAFSQSLFDECRKATVDYVVMAGFIKMVEVPPDFVNRVLNIHPSLVPAFSGKGFYGHHVHEEALKYGVKISGCTVHFVDNEYDHGPVILQRCVPVYDNDTPDVLNDRVFEAERDAYPEALQLLAENRIRIQGRKVMIVDAAAPVAVQPVEENGPAPPAEEPVSNPDTW